MIAEIFPETADCIVPTIVQLELCKWLTREVGDVRSLIHKKYCVRDSIAYDADLITCDAHFEGLPNVVFFRKA